jgi:hypothetical protein
MGRNGNPLMAGFLIFVEPASNVTAGAAMIVALIALRFCTRLVQFWECRFCIGFRVRVKQIEPPHVAADFVNSRLRPARDGSKIRSFIAREGFFPGGALFS